MAEPAVTEHQGVAKKRNKGSDSLIGYYLGKTFAALYRTSDGICARSAAGVVVTVVDAKYKRLMDDRYTHPLVRVLPLHLINLGHAGIAHRCDIAFWSDGYEILRSIQYCVHPCKFRE